MTSAARPPICPVCGHRPTPPRQERSPLRKLLRLGPPAPGCNYDDSQHGLRIAVCPCRNAWHAATAGA